MIETRVNSNLQESVPLLPSSELEKLHPKTDGVEELLQVQLNRYACGGVVVGLTAHHRVADGQSMNTFFAVWARLVKGLEVESLPYHGRSAIAAPRNPPKLEFNHDEIEFRKVPAGRAVIRNENPNVVVRYSAEFISKLKGRFQSRDSSRNYSTFLCLLVHVWKKVTTVRGLAPGEMTQVTLAVNGRTRMKPRVPVEYFGNLVLWAKPQMTVEELLRKSYGEVADVIYDAVSAVDDGYFKSFIDFGAAAPAALETTAPAAGTCLSPRMEVDSWLSFQYHELDFGGGGPIQVLTYFPTEGTCIFLRPPDEKGGLDVHVVLLPEQVMAFKTIAHGLPKPGL